MIDVWRVVGNILLVITFVPFFGFLVLYLIRTPKWYKTDFGKFMIALNGVITLQLALGLLRIGLQGNEIWFLITRFVTFLLIPIVGFWQLSLLLKAQREDRR
jgi:hypothetical protein